MSKPPVAAGGRTGQGRVGHERQRAGHDHPDRLRGLLGLAAQLGQLRGPLRRRPASARMSSAVSASPQVPTGRPGACRRPQGRRRGTGRAGSRRPCWTRTWRPRCRSWLTALANPSARRIAVAGSCAARDRVPPERGRHAADALRVEHVHRAAARADPGGELEHVVLGGGGHDRARVVQDELGDQAVLRVRGGAITSSAPRPAPADSGGSAPGRCQDSAHPGGCSRRQNGSDGRARRRGGTRPAGPTAATARTRSRARGRDAAAGAAAAAGSGPGSGAGRECGPKHQRSAAPQSRPG